MTPTAPAADRSDVTRPPEGAADPPEGGRPPAAPGWAAPDAAPPQPSGWERPPPQEPPGGAPPQGGWGAPPQGGWGAPPQGGWGAPPGWGASSGWGAPRPPQERPGIVPLRPLGLGELLDGAVTVVRRYPRPTLGLSTAIAVVTTVLNIPFMLSYLNGPLLDPASLASGSSAEIQAAVGSLAAGAGASSLVSFLAGVVLAGVMAAVVGKGVLGQPITLDQAWRQVRPLLLRLIGLSLVVLLAIWGVFVAAVAVAVGVVALGGPLALIIAVPLVAVAAVVSVHLYVRFALAPCAMVLERGGIRASLRRSALLVKGDWWRVFGILLLTVLITSFVSSVLQAPFSIGSFGAVFSGQPAHVSALETVLTLLGQAITLAVVSPFEAAVSALLYVDRRIRAEALDVQLAAAAGVRRA